MSDHEFEKQVRQKLNDLKITPSAQAWENIEERLRERRRRKPLLWLPLLLAGIAAGGYYFSSHSWPFNNGRVTSTTGRYRLAPEGKNIAGTENSRDGVLKNNHRSLLDEEPRNKNNAGTSRVDIKENNPTNIDESIHSVTGVKKQSAKSDISSKKDIKENRHGIAGARKQSARPGEKRSEELSGLASELNSDKQVMQRERFKPANQSSRSPHEPSDSVQLQGKNLPPMLSQAPVNNNNATAPVTKTVSKVSGSKWSYAVNLYTGVSMINKNALSPKKSMLQNAEYPQNAFAAVVASYAPVYKPGVTSPGLTLSAGVDVKRELSKRFSLAAGLDYTQINTFLKAGEQYSSTLSAYGLRGYLLSNAAMVQNEIKVYKNRYHFIDLPLTLHTRLNNSTRLPLFWDAGIVVSRLLGSASAHFDPSNGLYYSDDSLVNKTQAGLMTGFSLALFNRTKHPLWVGPSVRSNISSVLKNNASDARHFVTFGIDLKFFLKK